MMDLGGMADITSANLGIFQTWYGADQAKKGRNRMEKELRRISYTRPEEYDQIMSTLRGRVSEIPSRREGAEERIRGRTATAIEDIRQTADSPVAALGAYGGLKGREISAIKDLGMEYEERRDRAKMDVVGGLRMGADYTDKENYFNDMYKHMVGANIGASQMGAGEQMMWGGLDLAASGLAGTADYFGSMGGGEDGPSGNTQNPYGGSKTDPTPQGGGSLANI